MYVLVKLLLQAGCVHFTSVPSPQTCDIKVLILLYTSEKRAYLGFIPNDQAAFVDRLRKVIQHQKTTQALIRQQGGQVSNLCLAKGQAFKVFVIQGGAELTNTFQMVIGNIWKQGKISETICKYVQVCFLLPTDYKLIF